MENSRKNARFLVQASHFEGIGKLYQDLIKRRLSQDDHLQGLQGQGLEIIHFNQENKMLAFLRTHDLYPENPVLVILNFSNRRFNEYEIGVPMGTNWETNFTMNMTLIPRLLP